MKLIKDFIDSVLNNFRNVIPTNKITSIMPPAAINNIYSGNLVQINTDTVLLSNAETCYFIDRAILVTQKNIVTRYTGGSSGWSFRLARGINYRTGRRRGVPVREDVKEFTKGILYITNHRIIFAAQKNGFEKNINLLSVITPYRDAVILQFGDTSHTLLLPDGNMVFNVINLLKS